MDELSGPTPERVLALTFQRQFRTPSSEGYTILADAQRAGRVDLHFATENVHATIILELDFDEREVTQIIEAIDDQLVVTATVRREDLQVYVYHGQEVGFYDDDALDDEGDLGDDPDTDVFPPGT